MFLNSLTCQCLMTQQFFPSMFFFVRTKVFSQEMSVIGRHQTHVFFCHNQKHYCHLLSLSCGCWCRIRQMKKVDMISELPGHISFFRKKSRKKTNLDVCCYVYVGICIQVCSSETMGHLMYYRVMNIIRVLKKENRFCEFYRKLVIANYCLQERHCTKIAKAPSLGQGQDFRYIK